MKLEKWAAILALAAPVVGIAQSNADSSHRKTESIPDLVSRLDAGQKQVFDDATRAFREKRFADSAALHKQLLKDFPGDTVLLKFLAEDQIQSGDTGSAMTLLKPIAEADPDDWQAAALLVHACGQSGDTACRDAQIAHLLDLHNRGVTPPQFYEYPVETVKVGNNTLLIQNSLVPWGYYKVYALGKVFDAGGNLLMSITLESNDFDQPGFAKEHPAEAAKGIRLFSLDAYRETGTNSSGQRTQTHYTYKFLTGQPEYAIIRQEFIDIAGEKTKPVSSRSGLIVQ